MAESTCFETMGRFCLAVVAVFGKDYLRARTKQNTARIMTHNATRGFPGMLGSTDYMHWAWKNCPFLVGIVQRSHRRMQCNI
jgi:hypothetical protein